MIKYTIRNEALYNYNSVAHRVVILSKQNKHIKASRLMIEHGITADMIQCSDFINRLHFRITKCVYFLLIRKRKKDME